ncbi:ABC transporter substrate-binding protein [Photobacterium sanctipauli]|uniref:ABC transporter substrate-binding protein n=1 Tax=Photobacterium sanctipauli TaxID=1342794 RepID=A0A2T3NGI8_9GAMM|nr:ABC transporter substrate-binding protein [Photobacterium sanctipauli]PSW13906.1 ABC transporter substrate-binding protein [Photobacterium sanctipauli]
MMRVATYCFALLLFITPCFVAATNQLIILTTFTEASLQPLLKQFQQHHPDTEFKVLHRREASGLRLLSDNQHDIDIVISSSLSLFIPLSQQNRILPLNELNYDSAVQQQLLLPDTVNNVAIFGYSGYGFMWNQDYLDKHRLDLPSRWEDLADPQYFRHLVMSSPSRSGTTHIMVENILQQHGWKDGWRLLLKIGGNLASVSARSYGVSDAIARGLAGIGPVIDSYAYSSQAQFPFIGFSYQPSSPLLPSYVAALPNLHQAKQTMAFVHFLLSEQVQDNLSISSMNKYALNQKLSQPYEVVSLDHALMQQRSTLVKALFEYSVNRQLIRLNQAWQLIHEVEKLTTLTPDQQHKFNLAKRLASTPPITERQARSEILQQSISLSSKDINSIQLTRQWQQLMTDQLDHAIAICEQLLDDEGGHS